MKRLFMKIAIVSSMILAGFSMTGCTPYQEGLATGLVVGAGTTSAYNNNGYRNNDRNNYRTNRNSLYRVGVRNGCNSARGRWYKNSHRWRTSANYRNGWRSGYRRCR